MSLQTIAAILFMLLAVLHSVLGEKEILKPLLAQDWEIGLPRDGMNRLIRFAWHLTSIAWLGIAAGILGTPFVQTAAWVAVWSGVLVFVLLRGHLAWPMFLLAAGCLWEAGNTWPGGALIPSIVVIAAVLLAVGAAILHIYWAFGGQWGMQHVVPRREDNRPAFSPGPAACLAVTCALLAFAGALIWVSRGGEEWWLRWFLLGASAFMALRAIGDGNQVGFSKSNRSTSFAQYDDLLFTPLVVLLLFGALSALSF